MTVIPGEVLVAEGAIELNPGRPVGLLRVENSGDRPIQVGSHYHLAAANPSLRLDLKAAWGMRLNIPAGTSVRFEPGVARDVEVVPIAGLRIVPGLRPEVAGPLDSAPSGAATTTGPAADGGSHG